MDRLATDFDAVEFEPHVTLFCGPSNWAEAQATGRRITARFPPVELSVDRLDYSHRFTKTLFHLSPMSRAATAVPPMMPIAPTPMAMLKNWNGAGELRSIRIRIELSPIFGDGLKDQAAAVWD